MPAGAPSGGAAPNDPARSGVTWAQLSVEVPGLATRVQERFEAHTRHVLATRTIIGSPRVSGTPTGWWRGEMWIASPAGAPRGRDLRSDARFALHSNPGDGSGPDAKVGGLVVELVRGQQHADLVEQAQLSGSTDVFLLRLRTVRLAARDHEREEAGPTRWRVDGDTHRH